MNLLPLEIVHRILEYDGRIKYRNGKYMNQICKDDDRYKMLQSIPQILPYPNHLQHGYLMIVDTSNKIYCEKKELHIQLHIMAKKYILFLQRVVQKRFNISLLTKVVIIILLSINTKHHHQHHS